jgi:hypothetical protein
MSQIIENLTIEIGKVRFSVLSNYKIQLEYKVSIMYQDSKLEELKMKFRYKRKGDYWYLIPIKETFFNRLSVSYGIKKKNIKVKYYSNTNPIKINISDEEFIVINSLFSHFIFDDISWYRNMLLKKLLSK